MIVITIPVIIHYVYITEDRRRGVVGEPGTEMDHVYFVYGYDSLVWKRIQLTIQINKQLGLMIDDFNPEQWETLEEAEAEIKKILSKKKEKKN